MDHHFSFLACEDDQYSPKIGRCARVQPDWPTFGTDQGLAVLMLIALMIKVPIMMPGITRAASGCGCFIWWFTLRFSHSLKGKSLLTINS